MKALQQLRHILKSLAQEVEVLPAVGGAVKAGGTVMIFVGELNKYAPAREKGSPSIEQVLDIAERGRLLQAAEEAGKKLGPRQRSRPTRQPIPTEGVAHEPRPCHLHRR